LISLYGIVKYFLKKNHPQINSDEGR
jgi:hypothetical protein